LLLDKDRGNEASLTVGVFVDGLKPSEGGAAAFTSSLVEAITGTRQKHKFVLFHKKMHGFSFEESIPFVDIEKDLSMGMISRIRNKLSATERAAPAIYAPLEEAIKKYAVDFMWFLSPTDKMVSIPSIYTVWDLQHRVNPMFPEVSVTGWGWDERERTYSLTLPRATRIFTGTKWGKKEIVHFYRINPDLVDVIPLPVPVLTLKDTIPNESDVIIRYNLKDDYLFYPAQFWPHKNHANIVLALDVLRNKYSLQVDMVFVGSDKGNENYIKELVRQLDLEEHCHFLGYVPHEELTQLFRNAYALLYATFVGPDSLPPLEAFALGCPVIASRISGTEEQLGNAALYFDPKSPEEMASAIKKLYDDRELREELIRRGRDQIHGRSPREYVGRVNDILDDLAQVRRCWDDRYQ